MPGPILRCHDDGYDYVLQLPEGATVSTDNPKRLVDVSCPIPRDPIFELDRVSLVDWMLIEAAEDGIVPGLAILEKVSRWDNPADAEILIRISPLELIAVEHPAPAPAG